MSFMTLYLKAGNALTADQENELKVLMMDYCQKIGQQTAEVHKDSKRDKNYAAIIDGQIFDPDAVKSYLADKRKIDAEHKSHKALMFDIWSKDIEQRFVIAANCFLVKHRGYGYYNAPSLDEVIDKDYIILSLGADQKAIHVSTIFDAMGYKYDFTDVEADKTRFAKRASEVTLDKIRKAFDSCRAKSFSRNIGEAPTGIYVPARYIDPAKTSTEVYYYIPNSELQIIDK